MSVAPGRSIAAEFALPGIVSSSSANRIARDTPKIALPVRVLSVIACSEKLAGFY
jgi:hypothetical protein